MELSCVVCFIDWRCTPSPTAIPRRMHRISFDLRSLAAQGPASTRVGDCLGRPQGAVGFSRLAAMRRLSVLLLLCLLLLLLLLSLLLLLRPHNVKQQGATCCQNTCLHRDAHAPPPIRAPHTTQIPNQDLPKILVHPSSRSSRTLRRGVGRPL